MSECWCKLLPKMDIFLKSCCFFFFSILICLTSVDGLECYACDNQDSNKDKCIKTTKQCEEHQDTCITTIKWGLPPYWTPYGERYHYVFKECDTRTACDEKKEAMNMHCKRDWFDDWSCIECCTGDLCNFYVTLGAGTVKSSVILLTAAVTIALGIINR